MMDFDSEEADNSSEGPATRSRSAANMCIDKYINEAMKKKRTRRGKGKAATSDDLSSQIMVPIGVMYHCDKKGRGVHIRGGRLKNILLRVDCTYSRMLDKCVQELYSKEEQEQNDFYMADTRGIAIWNGDKIEVDVEGSGERARECDWTLEQYIHLSSAKFFSKSRFYCVKKSKVTVDTPSEDDYTGSSSDYTAASSGARSVTRTDVNVEVAAPSISGDVQKSSEGSTAMEVCHDVVWKPFSPIFVKRTKSHYRDEWRFTTLDQQGVLSRIGDAEVEHKYDEPGNTGLAPENPLHFDDVFFAGLEIMIGGDISLVETCDRRSGSVIYKKSNQDGSFNVWTGGFSCPGEEVALLACVAKAGYHSSCRYQWFRDDRSLDDECHPILYATQCGSYKCEIQCQERGPVEFKFSVEEDDNKIWRVSQCSNERKMATNTIADTTELKLLEVIGQGSFGTVYSAAWRGSVIAAKVIPVHMAEAASVTREIEIVRKLQHPNLSSCLGIERLSNGIAILSPLVRGDNLHNYIFGSTKQLIFPEKLYVFLQVCQAVVYLHTGVPAMAHLDIKPANILVDSLTTHATLTDFGLTQAMSGTTVIGTKTMMAGTPGFQSPEQLRSESLGPHCDVYAFGCVMVVTIQERMLWPNLTPYQIVAKVTVNNELPDISDLTGAMKSMCNKCLLPMDSRPNIVSVLQDLMTIGKGIPGINTGCNC